MTFKQLHIVALLILVGANLAASSPRDDPSASTVSFAKQVRPIFNQHCIACHGGIKRAAGISFVYRETIVGDDADDGKVIIAGDSDASELLARVSAEDDSDRMPPAEHGERLSAEEIDTLRQWIAEGAKWETHWAFESPKRSPLPQVSQPQWCQTDLDYLVLKSLDQSGIQPSVPADPATWLRRVTLDLIGLPPSEAELDEFLADSSVRAREVVVDRLLSAPQFGERWATPWLDMARYADTMGYEKDPPREIWPFRDWVIRALNSDMSFDDFTIKQIAGDLLPDATIDDRLATAFHRNTQANTEGGTDDEEFRVAAVIDRANTTAQIWLGLTLGCAQCHDHPYEPITNEEYYQFLAFFNNTRDYDTNEEFPRAAIPYDANSWSQASQLDRKIKSIRDKIHATVLSMLIQDTSWQNATVQSATATGTTVLEIQSVEGLSEIRTSASLSAGSQYSIECVIPEDTNCLTAFRLEVIPLDEEAAGKIPQTGFILSQLKLFLIEPGLEPREIQLQYAFDDDPEPFYSAQESLNPDLQGWSNYPKQSRISRAAFVPTRPVACPPGTVLRFVLDQQSTSEHLFQIRRARFWLSGDDFWTQLSQAGGMENALCEWASLRTERARLNSISVPIMVELSPAQSRSTRVFHRGSFLDPTSVVAASTPNILPQLHRTQSPARLDLAHWLVAPENPLTPRVFVNRIWSEIFGNGLVESIENFGSSGISPSHQELLDHLATQFQFEFHWSLKRLLREIVLSKTYGQNSAAPPDRWASDPRNQRLGRGPRNRLSAEMIRDQALVVSGLLSEKMFGFPVMPLQPDGLWQSAYSGETWHNSTGEDRYRRAVYTYCKRTSGYPGLLTFDSPTRDVCVVKRIATNTPLQALATMNDLAFVELAQALGQRMSGQDAMNSREKIDWGYRMATSHHPTREKLDLLQRLYEQSTDAADVDPKTTDAVNPYAVVAATILNLDEALTK